ncbi:MAG: hypothetical protein WD794_02350 [Mycobacteriales bacterium]
MYASSATGTTSGTADTACADDDVSARRARGIALIVGALLIVALVETETIPFYWFPALTGLTYLAAAAAGRSRGTLWGPGFVVTSVGLAAALWLRDGRMPDSFQFLALAVMALGLGGVLAALLTQIRGFSISAMSVAMPVLLFGVFALLEQQRVSPFAGQTWVYAALLALWGAYELRPARNG